MCLSFCRVEVAPGPDMSKIKLNDFEDEVFVDCTNEFELDPSDIFGPGNAEGNIDPEAAVDCEIVGPSGEPVDTYVSKVEPEGPFHVSCIHNYCRDGRGSVFFYFIRAKSLSDPAPNSCKNS